MDKQKLQTELNKHSELVNQYGNMSVLDYKNKNFLLHIHDDMKADMIKFDIQILNESFDCIVKVDTKDGYVEFENDTPDDISNVFGEVLFNEIKNN